LEEEVRAVHLIWKTMQGHRTFELYRTLPSEGPCLCGSGDPLLLPPPCLLHCLDSVAQGEG